MTSPTAPGGLASGGLDPAVGSPVESGAACQPGGSTAPVASPADWWTDRVVYEVFVRSFADSGHDGVGDLRGVIAHLDQLNDGDPKTTTDLGVTAIWLMPILASPSYHGYDVTDYEAVQPAYGSLTDLRALVAVARQRGIDVILDMPFNHTSDKHPWFLDAQRPGSAHRDWYVWSDSPQGSGWYPTGGHYYYAAFGASMPDLNLRNPAVTAELVSIARFWLRDVGVDGLRLDAAKYLIEDGPNQTNTPETHAWLHDFKAAVDAFAPGALLLGEVWDTPNVSASYVPADVDMTFDFGLAGAYVAAAGSGDGAALSRVVARVSSLYPTGGFGAFLTNHDMDRVASQLGGDASKLKLAAALLLTGPGTPFIYYGEEIGLSGTKPDERIRTPMRWNASGSTEGFSAAAPWESLSPDPPSVNVATEAADPTSLYSRYRDLLHFRAAHPALSVGDVVTVASSSSAVLAELRDGPSERLLVLANLSAQPVGEYSLSLAAGTLCDIRQARVVLGDGTSAATAAVPRPNAHGGFTGYRPLPSLPARSVTVLALAP